MKMSLDEIQELREQALDYDLLGADLLCDYTTADLQMICNGIGPDFFPVKLRKLLNNLHPTLKAAAMIHDLRYYLGKNNWEDFTEANDQLAINGTIAAYETYRFWDPRRYIVIRQARLFASLCQAGGWYAYLEAIKQREAKQ